MTHQPIRLHAYTHLPGGSDPIPLLPTDALKADINASTLGNNTLVAAVSSKVIEVYNLFLVASDSVVVTFKSGGGTTLSGPVTLVGSTGFSLPFSPWFETVSGEALLLNLSLGVQVGGFVAYRTK